MQWWGPPLPRPSCVVFCLAVGQPGAWLRARVVVLRVLLFFCFFGAACRHVALPVFRPLTRCQCSILLPWVLACAVFFSCWLFDAVLRGIVVCCIVSCYVALQWHAFGRPPPCLPRCFFCAVRCPVFGDDGCGAVPCVWCFACPRPGILVRALQRGVTRRLVALFLLCHAVVRCCAVCCFFLVLCLVFPWRCGLFLSVWCSPVVCLAVWCWCGALFCCAGVWYAVLLGAASCCGVSCCCVLYGWFGMLLLALSLVVARLGALFVGGVLRCPAVLPAVFCVLFLVLYSVVPRLRCCAVLCWRTYVVSLCGALLPLLCRFVPCAAACDFWLFVIASRCPVLSPCGALRRWCLYLAAWPAALICVVVCHGALLPSVVFCFAVLPCGAVLSCSLVCLRCCLCSLFLLPCKNHCKTRKNFFTFCFLFFEIKLYITQHTREQEDQEHISDLYVRCRPPRRRCRGYCCLVLLLVLDMVLRSLKSELRT